MDLSAQLEYYKLANANGIKVGLGLGLRSGLRLEISLVYVSVVIVVRGNVLHSTEEPNSAVSTNRLLILSADRLAVSRHL